MQSEAGQNLDKIFARKELERQAGEGLFFWGVGNAPARAIPQLARLGRRVDVLFSIMKSRPKHDDVSPDRVVAWRRFVDLDGVMRSLPPHVLVTSRATSRPCHYALMCKSTDPVTVGDLGAFDPAAFRNHGGNGAPVGASQVTALLERARPDQECRYSIAMRATLTAGYWIKLIDPVEVCARDREAMNRTTDIKAWLDLVHSIKNRRASGSYGRNLPSAQPTLFAI
jgi:hypothetical protein